MDTVKDWGENKLVSHISQNLPTNDQLIVGPGDDCAVIKLNNSWDGLLKTDVIVESIHFTPDEHMSRVGWKALARNVSDIAAMGGIPQHALVTLLMGKDTPIHHITEIYKGLNACAQHFNISIAGGETASLPYSGLIINVSLYGIVERGEAILRSTAQVGDVIFVSGLLGDTLNTGHHLDFEPRVKQGRFLREHHYASSMMDISDGIAKDLPRLAHASHVGFVLFEPDEHFPARDGVTPEQALTDGEDYELLFTVNMDQAENLLNDWKIQFPDVKLTDIGTIVPEIDSQTLHGGWEHFVS